MNNQRSELARTVGLFVCVCATIAILVAALAGLNEKHAPRPLPDTATWPKPVQEIRSEVQRFGSNVSGMELLLIEGKPASDLSEVVCRLFDSPELMELLKQKLEL